MNRVKKSARWLLVTFSVIVLTSVTVDATLNPNSLSQSALGILATSLEEEARACEDGMVLLTGEERLCVDIYEAAPGDACPNHDVRNIQDTRTNMQTQTCLPVSKKDTVPWTYITLHQAHELCARAGKRLLINKEWYRAALGTPDVSNVPSCNTESESIKKTGEAPLCLSGIGAYDMIGNVWEWVDGSVENLTYKDRVLPASGYVSEADQDGVVITTDETPVLDYYKDYFWSESQGVYGMMRGGFYGSRGDAGVYTLQAKTPPSFAGGAIGFRCAMTPDI